MVRLYISIHSLAVIPSEIDSAGFFNGFLPCFCEQNCRSVQLVRDNLRLVNQQRLRSLQLINELCGCLFTLACLRLLLHREAINECLWELHADFFD